MTTLDRGDWLQTYLGGKFYPLDPRPDEIFIEDIAHSLAMQCRYAGHSLRFYSVAEHCYHVSYAVLQENALWGLLHDASEAYIQDIIRPVKPYLANYKGIEEKVMRAIATKFDLEWPMPDEVKAADYSILANEKEAVMRPGLEWYAVGDPIPGVEIDCWPHHIAKGFFLARFKLLASLGE